MKRSILSCLMVLASALGLQAQWDTLVAQEPIRNIVKISPFHFAEGTFLLSYERMFSTKASGVIMLGLHSKENNFSADGPSFGFQEELQLRSYVLPPKNTGVNGGGFLYFKGLYGGIFLYHRYRSQTREVFDWILQENVEVHENINEFAGGVVLGTQIAFGNRLYMDFYTGGGIKRSMGRSEDYNPFGSLFAPGYSGVIPKIGFQLGVGL